MKNPSAPIFDSSRPRGKLMWLPKLAAGVAIPGTFALVAYAFLGPRGNTQTILFCLAAAWAICAPGWFFIEYHYFYREAPGGEDSWELFKHGQQLAIAVWAAFAATLYALGSSDIAKPPKELIECSFTLPEEVTANTEFTASIRCAK